MTLLYIRMGRSVSFGDRRWRIWVPIIGLTSTALVGIQLTGASIPGLFDDYSLTTAVLSTAALLAIRRNLAALDEPTDT